MTAFSAIALIVQTSVGLMFLASGLAKTLHPSRFVDGLRHYGISRAVFAMPVAIGLLLLELSLAACHIVGWRIEVTALAGSITTLLIGAAVFTALRSGSNVPCLCFGANPSEKLSSHTLIRLALLLIAEFSLVGFKLWALEWPMLHQVNSRTALQLLIASTMSLVLVSWLITLFEVIRSHLKLASVERAAVPWPTTD